MSVPTIPIVSGGRGGVVSVMCEVCISDRACLLWNITWIFDLARTRDHDDWCDFGTIDSSTPRRLSRIPSLSGGNFGGKGKWDKTGHVCTLSRSPTCRSDDPWIPDKSGDPEGLLLAAVFLADPGRSWSVEATTTWSSTDQASSHESPFPPLSAHVWFDFLCCHRDNSDGTAER